MPRWPSALLALSLCVGCKNAASPRVDSPPPAEGPIVPFFVLPELLDVDPYRGGAQKDVGPALMMNTPQRRAGALDHVLLVFSKVPIDRFQKEAAPAVWKELHVPYDVGVVWRPGFFDASVQAVVVSTHPFASFEDVETAEESESHEQSVELENGKMTQREASHLGVRVTSAHVRRLASRATRASTRDTRSSLRTTVGLPASALRGRTTARSTSASPGSTTTRKRNGRRRTSSRRSAVVVRAVDRHAKVVASLSQVAEHAIRCPRARG